MPLWGLAGRRAAKRPAHTHMILPDGFALSPILPNEITVRDDSRADEWLAMAHRLFALWTARWLASAPRLPRGAGRPCALSRQREVRTFSACT